MQYTRLRQVTETRQQIFPERDFCDRGYSDNRT